jgi:exopolysaccharide biosynthesis polyprenyl glycosylphosphotransferase
MLKRYQGTAGLWLRALDVLALAIAWLVVYPIRFHLFHWFTSKGIPEFENYLTLLPLVLLIWVAVFSATKVYEMSGYLRRTEEVLRMLRSHAFAFVCFVSATFLITEFRYSRFVMLLFAVLSGVLLWLLRLGVREWFKRQALSGHFRHNLVWLGDSIQSEEVLSWFRRYPEFGIFPLRKIEHHDWKNLSQIARAEEIRAVLVFASDSGAEEISSILQLTRSEPVDVLYVPKVSELVNVGASLVDFRGIPVVEVNSAPGSEVEHFFKRVMDVVLSGLGLLFLTPLLILVGIAIRLSSKGPVLYRQERMGLDGQTFAIWKFRTMAADAESSTGAVWTTENDPRRTSLGSFLRSTSIDELPQLINVFQGSMSLVGPRPERPVFVEKFKQEIPGYMLRHKVRAGMTGWAQINGWRGNTSLEKRIEYDLYYIRNWSLWLDFRILALTVIRGFMNKNAY